eukprot:UN17604
MLPKSLMETNVTADAVIGEHQLTGGYGEPKWLECIYCSKWRKIPANVKTEDIPQDFICTLNQWDTTNR